MTDLDPLTPTAQASYDRFTADLETGAAARRAAWAHEDFAPGHRPGRTPLSPAQFADAHAAVRAGLDRLTAHAPRWAHWTDFVARVEAAVAGAPRTHDGIRAALWRALSDAIAVEYRDASLESIDRAVTAPSAHVRRLGDDPARLVAAWVAIHGIAGEVGTAHGVRDLGWCAARAAAVTGVDTAPLLPPRRPTVAEIAEGRARANAAGRRAVDAPPAGAPVDPADVQPGDVAWNAGGARMTVLRFNPETGHVLLDGRGAGEILTKVDRYAFVRPPAAAAGCGMRTYVEETAPGAFQAKIKYAFEGDSYRWLEAVCSSAEAAAAWLETTTRELHADRSCGCPPAPEPEAPAVEEPVAVPVRRGLGPVRVSDGEHAAVVERWDVADTIRPWLPDAPEEVVAAVAGLQAALDERPAVSARAAAVAAGLGITVEPEPEGAPVDADPWADAAADGARAELEEARRAALDLLGTTERLRAERDAARAELATVKDQLARAVDTAVSSSVELDSARREVEHLRAQLNATRTALAEARADLLMFRVEDIDTDAAERAVDEVLAADERDGIRR